MGYIALGLMVAFGVVCLGLRGWIHYRQTGKSAFLEGRINGSVAILGFALPATAAAVLDITGRLGRVIDSNVLGMFGAVVATLGIVATLWAQFAMGDSWRVGIDREERTALVTTGPYERVRNPIYTSMFMFVIGLAMVVPNVVAITGAAIVMIVIHIVVRVEEEPYLLDVHGESFRQWKARTGRYLPRLHRA